MSMLPDSPRPAGAEPAWLEHRQRADGLAVRGEMTRALQAYGDAVEAARAAADEAALSELYGAIGEVHADQGDLDEAIRYFKSALVLDSDQHDELGKAGAHRRLGTAYKEKGDFDRSEDAYRDADRVLEPLPAERDVIRERAVLLREWGSLYHEQAQYSKAIEVYERALAVHRQQDDAVGEAVTLRHLARARHERGDMRRGDGAPDRRAAAPGAADGGGCAGADRGQEPDRRHPRGPGAYR